MHVCYCEPQPSFLWRFLWGIIILYVGLVAAKFALLGWVCLAIAGMLWNAIFADAN